MNHEYWDEVAGPVWVETQALMDEVLRYYRDALRPALETVGQGTIVDVGCGCGATTLEARRICPNAELIGVDVSRPMLASARTRARELGDSTIRFEHGDATTHPIEAGTVDLAISRFGVMFFDDPVAAFTAMRTWLKPSGKLVYVVWGSREENLWMTEMIGSMMPFLDLPPPDPTAPGPFSLADSARRDAIFDRAGLKLTEVLPLREPMSMPGTVDELVEFYSARGPVSIALKETSDERREAAIAALRTKIESHHDGKGVTLPALAERLTLEPR